VKWGVDFVFRSRSTDYFHCGAGKRRIFTAEIAEVAEQNAEDPGFTDESRIECIQPEPSRWRIEERFGTNLSSVAKISACSTGEIRLC
jgi:hypothetical protein